jgi:hypothetical protein
MARFHRSSEGRNDDPESRAHHHWMRFTVFRPGGDLSFGFPGYRSVYRRRRRSHILAAANGLLDNSIRLAVGGIRRHFRSRVHGLSVESIG